MRETQVWSLGWEDALEEGMATHSSILAWRFPMDGGAWQATVHGVAKTEQLNTTQQHHLWLRWRYAQVLFTIPPCNLSVNPETRTLYTAWWEFPGGQVVRIPGINCQGAGSVPGWGTEILQAVQHSWKKKKRTFRTFFSFTRWAAAGRGKIIAITATSPPNTTPLFLWPSCLQAEDSSHRIPLQNI